MKISERQLVERLRQAAMAQEVLRRAPRLSGRLRLRQGIGDDCAVFSHSQASELLVTTDLFLEWIHFRREWQPARSIGHKALARGLSDIAAMGGEPRYALLSLALPRKIPLRWLNEFFGGLFGLAEQAGVALAGGDTGASLSGILADIIVIGELPRGQAVLRSGARPGDEIWVTGRLGGAAHALELLRKRKQISRRSALLQPFFYPQPRLAIGRALRQRGLASAMLDLSDGLSIDLDRLCEASGVGAIIDGDAIPRSPQATLDEALHGGEDFELLFTVPASRRARVPRQIGGVALTRIGLIVARRGLRLVRAGREVPLPVRGFQHF